jgi:hypothetical protein
MVTATGKLVAKSAEGVQFVAAIDPKALFDKINALPIDRIAEVEDFVDFLRLRDQDRMLSRAASAASAPAFAVVWDNPEDDVYDDL